MRDRPYATAIFAMSADGKISDVRRSGRKFGSQRDFRQLEACVAAADAVLMGAGTLRSGGTAMRVLSDDLLQQRDAQGLPPQPRQLIISRSGNLSHDLPFFRQPIPRWLVTTTQGAIAWRDRLTFDRVWICEGSSDEHSPTDPKTGKTINLALMLQRLHADGIRQLAVLGGGELVAGLLAIGAIDELRITLCPLILGGAAAPTPVDGQGLTNLIDLDSSDRRSPPLQLLDAQIVEQEVFLRYRVRAEGADRDRGE